MCGLAGIVSPHLRGNPDELQKRAAAMAGAIWHRGPDAGGLWIEPKWGAAFGHRRLAIVDLSPAGLQPMLSSCGRFVLIFNGEIYNYKELRDRLESEDPSLTWRGSSDTEVLLLAISRWGLASALQASAGMFALALFDRFDGRLWLARDRYGEKPLYFRATPNSVVLASDLDGLLPGLDGEQEIDPIAIAEVLARGYIPHPRTIYAGIEKLAPASIAEFRLNGSHIERVDEQTFWSLPELVQDARSRPFTAGHNPDGELETILQQVVGQQMIADVPLGAFLSGGIDSSLVVALMQAQSSSAVRTFTIGIDDPDFDERMHAEAIAGHLQTDHTTFVLTPEQIWGLLPQVVDAYSEPFADSSQIPTLCVAKLAVEHVKVALTGDGGDELFGGYNRHVFAHEHAAALLSRPYSVRRRLAPVLRLLARDQSGSILDRMNRFLPAQRRPRLLAQKLGKLARVLDARDIGDFYCRVSRFETGEQDRPARQAIEVASAGSLSATRGLDPASQLMVWDGLTYLPGDILAKVDRATMAVSLESRAPFLDPRVAGVAWRTPIGLKVGAGRGKTILRRVLARHVPVHLFERPKAGFAIPLSSWLRTGLKPWAENLLRDPEEIAAASLDAQQVAASWDRLLAGRSERHETIWATLMYLAWTRRQTRGRPARPVVSHSRESIGDEGALRIVTS